MAKRAALAKRAQRKTGQQMLDNYFLSSATGGYMGIHYLGRIYRQFLCEAVVANMLYTGVLIYCLMQLSYFLPCFTAATTDPNTFG